MVYNVQEIQYKGFCLVLNEEGHGWKCVIGEQEVLFPHTQAAKAAINEILKDADTAIKMHGGKCIKKVPQSQVTKNVILEEKLY